ncbi:NAD(P)H-binding protein [Streptomyces indonesiensis]
MRIAVTTPTGNVGRHVVATLVRAGVRPRVLLRDPGRLAPDVRDEVDAVPVDQYDADAVVAATRDVDALFWVNPTSGHGDPLAEYARATDSVVRAVTENRIGRVVFQSSVGAEKRHGAGEIDGLAETEIALDGTGVDVTHLRCGYFFTNLEFELAALRAGTLQVILPLDQPMAWVAPRDIAEVAATRLLSPDWSGRCVQAVHGPADLTWREVGDILTAATGRRSPWSASPTTPCARNSARREWSRAWSRPCSACRRASARTSCPNSPAPSGPPPRPPSPPGPTTSYDTGSPTTSRKRAAGSRFL